MPEVFFLPSAGPPPLLDSSYHTQGIDPAGLICSFNTLYRSDIVGGDVLFRRYHPFTAKILLPGDDDWWIRTHDAQIPRRSSEQIWKILRLNEEAIQKHISGDASGSTKLKSLTEKYGWKGYPTVFNVGTALDIINSTPLPIFHLLLLGIVKNFVKYVYDGLKKAGTQSSEEVLRRNMKLVIPKKELDELEKGFIINSHVKKPYAKMESCYSWISEEVGLFVELYSPFLFNSDVIGRRVVSEEAEHAWHLLSKVVLYFLGRPTEEVMDMNKAHEYLYEFAKLCEEENISALVKPNLHTAICRLREQEEALGHPKHLGELWMERALRLIGEIKAIVYVDACHNKYHILREVIERNKYEIGLPIEESVIPKYQPRKNMPERYNTLCDIDGEVIGNEGDDTSYVLRFGGIGSEIVQSGRLNTGNDPIGNTMGELWIRQRTLPGNSRLSQDEFKISHGIIQFNSLAKERANGTVLCRLVKSKSKTRERKRISYLVEIPYQTIDQDTHEAITTTELAEVDILFMIARVDRSTQGKAINIAGDQQRFAQCHLLKTRKEGEFYILDYKRWENAYLQKNLVIPVSDIGRLVIGLMTTQQPSESGEVIERMVFKPHFTDHEDNFCKD